MDVAPEDPEYGGDEEYGQSHGLAAAHLPQLLDFTLEKYARLLDDLPLHRERQQDHV